MRSLLLGVIALAVLPTTLANGTNTKFSVDLVKILAGKQLIAGILFNGIGSSIRTGKAVTAEAAKSINKSFKSAFFDNVTKSMSAAQADLILSGLTTDCNLSLEKANSFTQQYVEYLSSTASLGCWPQWTDDTRTDIVEQATAHSEIASSISATFSMLCPTNAATIATYFARIPPVAESNALAYGLGGCI